MNTYAKAIVGASVAGLGALQIAAADNVITGPEWIKVASVTVAALALIWGVPNQPAPPPAA